MSDKKAPKYAQRIRAMEERLERETKESELRLQNDFDYAKSNIVRLTGTEVAAQISEQNPFVGRMMSKVFRDNDDHKQKYMLSEDGHEFRTRDNRTRPALRRSDGELKLGFKNVLENLILPIAFGIVRGKVMATGIKGSGKLLRTFLRRVRKAL